MDKECRNHIVSYILWIITGIAILYLFFAIYSKILETNATVQKIYTILDFNSICEEK